MPCLSFPRSEKSGAAAIHRIVNEAGSVIPLPFNPSAVLPNSHGSEFFDAAAGNRTKLISVNYGLGLVIWIR